MNSDNYRGLELDQVLLNVSRHCAFEASKEALLNSSVIYNPLLIKRNLQMTQEALKLLDRGINVDFSGVQDIRYALDKSLKGQTLNAMEILACLNFHNHCRRIKKIFFAVNDLDALHEYVDALNIDEKTYATISMMLDNNGQIKRQASKHLSELFDRDESLNHELQSKAKSFINEHSASLQEDNIYFRDDRMAFLLKNSDKNKYDGLHHGQSASGLASYVEPREFIDLNNAKVDIRDAKAKEIERLLKLMSSYIAQSANLYIHNFDTFIVLDNIFAKARYGQECDGTLAKLTDDRHLYMENIAHPLIDKNKVVRNTYELKNEYHGILITGANTGGKTVSLKVIGLAVLMTYLGIPLPCDRAQIPLFDAVLVDIDDNQSLESSLSTFSSQLVKLNELFKRMSDKSLILIDELGNGTDPKQAQALSIAIVDKLLMSSCRFVLTTHFEELKNYALTCHDILVSSVSFDSAKLMPTYHYLENSLGSSNALEIAAFYLDDKSLIAKAEAYLKENAAKQEKMMRELEKKLAENDKLKAELNALIQENEQSKTQYEEKYAAFEAKKDELLKNYNERLNNFIDSQKKEVKKLLASWNKEHKNPDILNKLDTYKVQENKQELSNENLKVGDDVRMENAEQVGTIIAINGNQAEISLNGLRVKTKLSSLTKMPKQKVSNKTHFERKPRAKKEVVLVGMRVEEALPLMEKYLDDAYASKMSQVRIVHGIGTGTLRKAIHEKLKKMRFVKEYHLADYYDGGSAVTIVEFK